MRILFLTQIIPWPLDAGPKVKTWNVLRHLHDQGHEILLVSFVRPEEEVHVSVMKSVCRAVYSIPMRRSRIKDALYYLRSHLSRRPFLVERDDLREMRNVVRNLLQDQQIDVIHADQLSMAQFAFDSNYPHPGSKLFNEYRMSSTKKPVLIFDAHNAVWTIVDRMRKNLPTILHPLLSLETKRIKKYEGAVIRAFDHTFAVTDIDADALRQAEREGSNSRTGQNGKISVVPIAIDANRILPVTRKSNSLNILTLGTLHYPPNADGIRWFANEVLPMIRAKIPTVHLTIVGRNPPKDIQMLAQVLPETIRVTGYVQDLDPYYTESALVVVPVRAGGGMRVRILETFARGMPLVTTSIGIEGINATPGVDVLIEDTAQGFADAVIRLLMDENLQQVLSVNGRKLVERKYDYHIVLEALENIYMQYAPDGSAEKQLGVKVNG